MPIRSSDFQSENMFRPLFEAVAAALKTEDLIPTADGQFMNSTQVKLARGRDLRELFDSTALTRLLTSPVALRWSSAEISPEGTADLYKYFRETLEITTVQNSTYSLLGSDFGEPDGVER